MQKLTRDGIWNAGFLRDDLADDWLVHKSKNWRPHSPTLIVIDYSTRRAESLLSCLYTLSDPTWQQAIGDAARVRLLVLDRPGGNFAPAAFEKLTGANELGNYDHQRRIIRAQLFGSGRRDDKIIEEPTYAGQKLPIIRDEELLRLGGMPRAQWRRVLNESLARVTDESVTLPNDDIGTWWERVKRLTGDGRPLFLQILGICLGRRSEYVDELTSGDEGLESLLDDMLNYEREHHWRDLFDDENIKISSEAFRSVERAVGFITLAGGIAWPRDEDALHACAGGSRETVEKVVFQILRATEEPETGSFHLPPLQPDLLGERLLVNLARRTIDRSRRPGAPSPPDPIDTDFWIGRALSIRHALSKPEAQAKDHRASTKAIDTLRLLAQDFPRSLETIQWIESLLRKLAERADANDDGVLRIAIFGLSRAASKVVRTLAAARDCLDESTQQLYLDRACGHLRLWLGSPQDSARAGQRLGQRDLQLRQG